MTGASSGIGEAIALALAGEGARVAVAARRAEELERVVKAARAAGAGDAQAFVVDLTDAASVSRLSNEVALQFGSVDILVLNGGGPKPGTYTATTLGDWDTGYRGTLRCMIELANGALPAMRERGWGRIVALTSSSVKQPIDNLALSNAFRVALVAAMKTLANEVADEGVTVNCIATGRVNTERLKHLYATVEEMDAAAQRDVPAGRVASPAEFAPLVAFLCGDPARYVTGQTISIDGGLVRGIFG
ncbi:MAG TPA: SDR family oxidoreductase [Candidatus Baltobacteraceae bacterium]